MCEEKAMKEHEENRGALKKALKIATIIQHRLIRLLPSY